MRLMMGKETHAIEHTLLVSTSQREDIKMVLMAIASGE